MNKPELDLGTFHVSENTLEDGSTTYDVYFSTPYDQELVAEPPSRFCANALAEALTIVRERLLDCGSDIEVAQCFDALIDWNDDTRRQSTRG
jgi:hypothetical protein